jgi:hypothetical protein
MGAIVTLPQTDEGAIHALSSKVTRRIKETSVSLTLADFPLLPFAEVHQLLPLCIQSWNHIARTFVDGQFLGDRFQLYAHQGLRELNSDVGWAIQSILSTCREKNSLNPVTYMMKYTVRAGRHDEIQFNKRLQTLGREHARIGVEQEMIMQFCTVMLNSFARCLDGSMAVDAIMYAWLANLKYIVTQMTIVRFSFLRIVSGVVECAKCGCCGSACACMSPTASSDVASTVSSARTVSSTPSSTQDSLFSFAYDGPIHACYTVSEGGSDEDALVLHASEGATDGDVGINDETVGERSNDERVGHL